MSFFSEQPFIFKLNYEKVMNVLSDIYHLDDLMESSQNAHSGSFVPFIKRMDYIEKMESLCMCFLSELYSRAVRYDKRFSATYKTEKDFIDSVCRPFKSIADIPDNLLDSVLFHLLLNKEIETNINPSFYRKYLKIKSDVSNN